MIRSFKESDLPLVMQIWLDSNIEAHSFIPAKYLSVYRKNGRAAYALVLCLKQL